MQFAGEKGSRRDHDRFCVKTVSELRFDAAYRIVLSQESGDERLLDFQILRLFEITFHGALVFDFVTLRAGRPDRRPFGKIKHPELNRGCIGDESHGTAERVDLPCEVPFGNAADTRVAAHLGDVIQIQSQHESLRTCPRRRQSRFAGGMSTADHNNIKIFIQVLKVK